MSRRGMVAATAGAVLGGITILVLWGQSTFVPLLLLCLTAALLHHGARVVPATPRSPLDPAEPPPPSAVLPNGLPLHGWSNAELCRAWQSSYVQLQRRPGPGWTEHLAELRRTYLDELYRRDPRGFSAWISSGARAASDPTRYLTTVPRTPHEDPTAPPA